MFVFLGKSVMATMFGLRNSSITSVSRPAVGLAIAHMSSIYKYGMMVYPYLTSEHTLY